MEIPRSERQKWIAVSGFFTDEAGPEHALDRFGQIGIPRDLIEVVLPQDLYPRFFGNRKLRKRRATFADAARGALWGLLIASLISTALILTSGAGDDRQLTLLMTFGPNMGVLAGSLIGALIGRLRSVRAPERYARALENKGPLVIVRVPSSSDAQRIKETLKACGGFDVKMQASS